MDKKRVYVYVGSIRRLIETKKTERAIQALEAFRDYLLGE